MIAARRMPQRAESRLPKHPPLSILKLMRFAPLALAAVLLSTIARAAELAAEVDFVREIKPLLAAHCTKCHGPSKQENGLRLDAGASVMKGGDNGVPVVAGKPDESLLILAVTGKSDVISQMPSEGEP